MFASLEAKRRVRATAETKARKQLEEAEAWHNSAQSKVVAIRQALGKSQAARPVAEESLGEGACNWYTDTNDLYGILHRQLFRQWLKVQGTITELWRALAAAEIDLREARTLLKEAADRHHVAEAGLDAINCTMVKVGLGKLPVKARVCVATPMRHRQSVHLFKRRIWSCMRFQKLMDAWCVQMKLSRRAVDFLHHGRRVAPEERPESCGWKAWQSGTLLLIARPKEGPEVILLAGRSPRRSPYAPGFRLMGRA